MKYKIITISRSAHAYIVEAESKEEAEKKFDDTEFECDFELPRYEVDSEEEIESIEEVQLQVNYETYVNFNNKTEFFNITAGSEEEAIEETKKFITVDLVEEED